MLNPQSTTSSNPQPHTQAQSQQQPSIRSFFQPKLPTYSAPPAQKSQAKSNTSSTPNIPNAPPPARQITPIPPPPKIVPVAPRSTSTTRSLPDISSDSVTKTTHPQAVISRIEKHHVQPLRRINSLLLPISYPDNFYHKITDPSTSPNFSRVILWTDKPTKSVPEPETLVVGGVVCRLDLDPASQTCQIYVQSLGILSPYRQSGLGTALMDEVIKHAVNQDIEPCPITSLYVHVWTDNQDALKWYAARGFLQEGDAIQGYYRRLTPDSAVLLRRVIKPSDHLLTTNTRTTSEDQKSSSSITAIRPNTLSASNRAVSYQQKGPGHEWNDLPSDILMPSSRNGSTRPSPNTSTLNLLPTDNSITAVPTTGAKLKKKRVYPTAAFGGT